MKISSVQPLLLVVLAGTVNLCLGTYQHCATDLRDRILIELIHPQALEDSCGRLNYELFIAVDRDHLGLFAQPTRDLPEGDVQEEKCGPVFFHQKDPATKEVGQSSLNKFAPGALYPLGDHDMSDLLEAFDSVPVSDAEYDIIKHHCALLVLHMMCSLEIPVIQQMLDWVGDELMKTNEARDHIISLAHNSTNFDVLGMAHNESTTTTIRTLVAYDADMFYCTATDVKQQVECSGASKVFSLLSLALLAVVTGFIAV
ncbi:unknown protein [Seminavis robusta]|uniref:Uncharacterized protein n=1 Tax=Seminavis robusta TaxID=568900 RepID=A0A9N8DIX1_9STRA|nr:unknown protein [Seminavis robusta]|eukprot:Sro107_g053960.1 n/a (257) ;mRNA; r:86962-87732